jgi:hypothetical protein
MLLWIFYLRYRLWLTRQNAAIQKFIGVKLLRCSARLAECGVWFLRKGGS